jgi:hypothetical protein
MCIPSEKLDPSHDMGPSGDGVSHRRFNVRQQYEFHGDVDGFRFVLFSALIRHGAVRNKENWHGAARCQGSDAWQE